MKIDQNAKIGIAGFGVEGIALINYLFAHGFSNIAIYDENAEAKQKLGEIHAGNPSLPILTRFGGNVFEYMDDRDVLFRSPGIHPDKIKIWRDRGITITSTTQYFMEHCPCPVIGVTGTKGKGTTSTLIYLMLKEAGYDVYLGGNIGQSPLDFLDKLKPESRVVLEMSSFQLQDLTISPQTAVVLNVSSDHLDYHRDMQEYREAKAAIVRYQNSEDTVILNQDYEYANLYERLTKAKKIEVSTHKKVDCGAYVEDGKIFININHEPELIGEIAKITLFGAHHLENILPAVCVAALHKVTSEHMRNVLYSFKGLPHRLQLVAEIDGVKYYDDSISTIPETSLAATKAFQTPIILIAGGAGKNADYQAWADELHNNIFVKAVLLIGQMAYKMEGALRKVSEKRSTLEVIVCKNLEEAVKKAHQKATSGTTVLLSPAATSFDMFKNYKDRGEKFEELVQALIKRNS